MFSTLTNDQKGIVLSFFAFTFFAFGDVFLKYLGQFYNPFTLAFYVASFILCLLVVLNRKLGGFEKTFKTPQWKWHVLRAFFFACEFICIIYGLSKLPLAISYALIFLAPFLAPLIAIPVLKIKPRKEQWLAIACGFVGVLVILRPGLTPITLPVIALLAAAFFFASANVLVRVIEDGKQTILSWALYIEIVTCLLTGMVYVSNPEILTPAHLFMVGCISVFFLAGLLMIGQAFIYAEPATAAPFQYIQILWGTLFGYLVFGDIPDIWTGIGATIIVGTGIWLVRHQRRPFIKDGL